MPVEKPLTAGSLFSGVGGMDIGLQMAGWEIAWQVEIDKYCRQVLEKHWPDAKRYEDIRDVGAHNLESVDLICGEFPCQDISVAGKGEGITGSRSGLWKEMFRIICELRPPFVLVENVPALLGRGIDVVLGDLAEGGYDAEWDCLPASVFGAPHRRDRAWIVAYTSSTGRQQDARSAFGNEKTHERWRTKNNYEFECDGQGDRKKDVADADVTGLEIRQKPENRRGNLWDKGTPVGKRSIEVCYPSVKGLSDWAGGEVEQPYPLTEFERPGGREIERDFCGVPHGVSRRVDRLKGLGNACVPQVVQWIGERIRGCYAR